MKFTNSYELGLEGHCGILRDDAFGFVDNGGTVQLFLLDDNGEPKPKPPQAFHSKVLHPYHKGDCASASGSLLCLYLDSKKKTFLLRHDPEKKSYVPVGELAWSEPSTEVSIFSSDEKLVATGGSDGKVCLYTTGNGKLLEMVSEGSEYVAALALSKSGEVLACSTFRKNLDVYDLKNNMLLQRHVHKEVVGAVAFLHKSNFLVFGARDNTVSLYDYTDGRVKKELCKTIGWPQCIHMEEDDAFCLVADKSGYVHFLDLFHPDAEPLHLFKQAKVTVDIKKRGESFYFFLEDGTIHVVDMAKEMEGLRIAYEQKDYETLFRLSTENPMLRHQAGALFGEAEEAFEQELDMAVDEIASGRMDAAKKRMEPFMGDEKNKERFHFYVLNAEKLKTFAKLYYDGQYDRVYSVADTGAFYKKTPMFKELEDQFVQVFNMAQMLLTGPDRNERRARDTMAPFLKIPDKREVCEYLLRHPEEFVAADKYFEKRDLQGFYDHIENHPAVKKAPIFREFSAEVDRMISTFLGHMHRKEYDQAYSSAVDLEAHLPDHYKKELAGEMAKAGTIRAFVTALEQNKYGEAIKLVTQHAFLITVDEYAKLGAFLNERFDVAVKLAQEGKIGPMDKVLRPFLKNGYTRNKTAKIYKLCYIAQIVQVAPKMQPAHWKNTFKNYVPRFGIDAEIEAVARRFDRDDMLEKFKATPVVGLERMPILPHIVKSVAK